jgi:flagellar motor component MotA
VYAFVILLGLGLGLGVAMEVVDELVPLKTPKALTRTIAAVIATLVVWGLDYSVFTAFGQALREQWMHYVATGIVLVAVADLTRELKAFVGGVARKTADEAAEIEHRIPRAA